MFEVGQTYDTLSPDRRKAKIICLVEGDRLAYLSRSKAGTEYVAMCQADGYEITTGKPFLIGPEVFEDFFVE